MSDGPALLHDFFFHSAARYPNRAALDIPPGVNRPERIQLTYAELAQRANRIATALPTSVRPDSVIAILLPRHQPLLLAAQLAVLQSGSAYTCLDPAFPDARLHEILADSAALILLTDDEGASRITSSTPICNVAQLPSTTITREPPNWLTPASLAYTIYTSGTPGTPNAVMIPHRAIVNLIASDLDTFRLTPETRVAQGSSSAYDSSVEETWLALSAGATVVVMDDDTNRLGPDLIPWLRAERINVFCPPPTLLRATGCDNPAAELPDLKLLYVGGEALPQDLSDRWSAPPLQLVNGYGPTECAVTSLRGSMHPGVPVHIGQPVANLIAHVLDSELCPVAADQQGELCLSGVGLALGYWNRPELTAEKFPVHPTLGRLYRTGDLVHRDPSGNFHYHGRADSQIKIRGYRVELGEIEARLAACPGVRGAACHLQREGNGETLVAFLVPANPATPPSFDAIRQSLSEAFPAYMIPARFGLLAELPTTTGGKLNHAALPFLEAPAHTPSTLTPPRDATETHLAEAIAAILEIHQPISIHDDFFAELGGDSLRAAQLVSRLRKTFPGTHIAVRDIYEARPSPTSVPGSQPRPTRPHQPRPQARADTSQPPQSNPSGSSQPSPSKPPPSGSSSAKPSPTSSPVSPPPQRSSSLSPPPWPASSSIRSQPSPPQSRPNAS